MERTVVKLGYVPTRRTIFSKEEAQRYRSLIKAKIIGFEGVEIIDIEDINEEGLLWQLSDVAKIAKKFRDKGVDALFFPHCNFGSEMLVTEVAASFRLPTLLWGPRDDSPDETGMRFRDSQCGLFATSKVMRRYNVPFTYITNVELANDIFSKGFERFLRVATVVKTMRHLRILQLGTRPTPFYSVIFNESELMEKFGAQIIPMALPDLTKIVFDIINKNGEEYRDLCQYISTNYKGPAIDDKESVKKFAGLKLAVRKVANDFQCDAAALQCWNALQDILGIAPCFVNSMMSDDGFPVACETDVHGAISALMLQASTGNVLPQFFADVTVRHPTDDNTELLWHCGPFPSSFAKDRESCLVRGKWHTNPNIMGNCFWELKPGDITVCRFDGDNGKYSVLMGEGKGVDGPHSMGTYVWFQVKNWPKWEHKLIKGPYIHHIAGTYGNYADVLYEACHYIPALEADPVEPSRDELEASWMY